MGISTVPQRFKRHTSPAMEMQLESTSEYGGIVSAQNGLGLTDLPKISTSSKTG